MAKPDARGGDCKNIWHCARMVVHCSQQAAADIVGVSRQAIGALENGQRQPKTAELLRLASLYRLRPEVLMAGGHHPMHLEATEC